MENIEKIKQGHIEDLIGLINKANETFAYPVYIPSLEREVRFREINTAQQKRLVKTIIDSPIFNTELIFALKNIIEENCVEKDIDINKLTILDKLFISIAMRAYSIGVDMNLTVSCPKCEKTQTFKASLLDLLEELKSKINVKTEEIIQDETNTFKVFCSLPTIETEYRLENEFRKNTKIEVKNEAELRETIGNVFISELVKFITKIEITNKEEGKIIELDLTGMSFKERAQIIEKLNVKTLKKVIEYISSVKKEFDKVTVISTTCNCGHPEKIEQRFSIDSNFFIVS